MNQITRQIKEILSVVLECDLSQQSDEADLILLGLDSIHFIQMIIALEDAPNKRIPDEYLGMAHHWFILHGRYVCTAKRANCEGCIISDKCMHNE